MAPRHRAIGEDDPMANDYRPPTTVICHQLTFGTSIKPIGPIFDWQL
jgi:hypothetical protein